MKASISPKVVAVIVLYFLLLLGMKFWFHEKSLEYTSVSHIHISPNGNLFVRNGNLLHEFTELGEQLNSYDLQKFGSVADNGDFAFLNNGKLITAFVDIAGDSKNVKSFKSCDLQSFSCEHFYSGERLFGLAYALEIDWEENDVYISLGNDDKILELNFKGDITGELETGLKSPNQIKIVDRRLWVANTNTHALYSFDREGDGIGEKIDEIKTKINLDYRWPVAFEKWDENWIVVVADSFLKNGRIFVYDSNGEEKKEIKLLENHDPFSIVSIGTSLVYSDWGNYSLFRLDPQTESISNFIVNPEFSELGKILYRNNIEANEFKKSSNLAWYAFLISVLLGFIIGLIQVGYGKNREDNEADPGKVHDKSIPLGQSENVIPIGGIWIEPNKLFGNLVYVLIVMSILGLCLSLLTQFLAPSIPLAFLLIITFGGFLFCAVPMYKMSKIRLCILQTGILVEANGKPTRITQFRKILWNQTGLAIGNRVIHMRKAPLTLYNVNLVKKIVLPQLAPQNTITQIEMLKYLWKSKEGMLKGVVIMMVCLLSGILVIEMELL